jgi:hypothetical protein
MARVVLPTPAGGTQVYETGVPRAFEGAGNGALPRVAFAAAHVVADPLAEQDPRSEAVLDWDATLDYRRYLWSLGLGVAEAMDTAQRGMGLDWETSLELIRRSVAAAADYDGPAVVACGVGTDHLGVDACQDLEQVIAAYEAQCGAVEAVGGRIILMASRALAAIATSPEGFVRLTPIRLNL